MRSPLGENEIGKFLSTTAKNASLQGRVTNHSVRKTCISRLFDANVSNNFVAQLSGHRNLKSLDVYKSASYRRASTTNVPCAESLQQRSDYDLGSHRNHYSSFTTVESASFNPVQLGSGFFSGATIGSFNICTFNLQLTSGQPSH